MKVRPSFRRYVNLHLKQLVAREGRCRLCGFDRKLTAHHLVPVRAGRDDRRDNLVALCQRCHSRVDCEQIEIREPARRALRSALTETERAYVDWRMGRGWLDRHYPLAHDSLASAFGSGHAMRVGVPAGNDGDAEAEEYNTGKEHD